MNCVETAPAGELCGNSARWSLAVLQPAEPARNIGRQGETELFLGSDCVTPKIKGKDILKDIFMNRNDEQMPVSVFGYFQILYSIWRLWRLSFYTRI